MSEAREEEAAGRVGRMAAGRVGRTAAGRVGRSERDGGEGPAENERG